MNENQVYWAKYLIALLITGGIFILTISVSNYFNERKLESIRTIENRIAIDILSSETQFDLIRESSCKLITTDVLSTELNDLARRVSFMESTRGPEDEELQSLKKQYALLEIKDFLLAERLHSQCDIKSVSILYFYSNLGDCKDCEKTGTILTYLREKYPGLRIYAFDYNLDLSAVKTLISLNKIENTLPAVVIQDEVFYDLTSLEAFEEAIPELKTLQVSTSTTATTTKR